MTIDEDMPTRQGGNQSPTEIFPEFPPIPDGQVPAGPGGGLAGPDSPGPGPAKTSKRSPSPGALPGGDTAVTRLLCSSVHLNGNFADEVASKLTDPEFISMAPSWGVDLVALTAHTMLSRGRRIGRDGRLAVLLVSAGLLILLLVLMVPFGGLGLVNALVLLFLILPVTWIIAFLMVFNHYDLVRISSLEVMKPDQPARATAPALDEELEARLESAANANVVVSGEYNPFVSFGMPLDSWSIVIDLLPARTEGHAEGLAVEYALDKVEDFTNLDLHRFLIQAMAERAEDLYTGSICFANGATANAIPGLIPRPPQVTSWPAQRLPQSVLDDMVAKPAENQRAYVLYSRTAWRGEIVISGLVRCERTGSRLLIEGRTHALLPLRGAYRETKFVAEYSSRVFTSVFWPAYRATTPLLMGSVKRRMTRRRAIFNYVHHMRRLCRALTRGVPRNYGAKSSLREQVMSPGDLKHNATVDEVAQYKILTRLLLDSVAEFLTAQGADLAQFDQQRTVILNRRDFSFNDTGAASSAFGPRNTTTVSAGVVVSAPDATSGS